MRAASPGLDRAECRLQLKPCAQRSDAPTVSRLLTSGPCADRRGPAGGGTPPSVAPGSRARCPDARARASGGGAERCLAEMLASRCTRDGACPIAGCRGRRGNQLLVRLTSAHSTRFEQSELWLDTRRSGGPAGPAHRAAHGPSRPQSSRISWPCTYSAAARPLPAGRARRASRARLLDACCPLLVPRARAGIRRPGSPWCLIVRGTHVTSSQESERHRC